MTDSLFTHPVHLGLGATATAQPEMTGGMAWYEAYAARTAPDGAEGRLVSMYDFTENWDMWEMHPRGAETAHRRHWRRPAAERRCPCEGRRRECRVRRHTRGRDHQNQNNGESLLKHDLPPAG